MIFGACSLFSFLFPFKREEGRREGEEAREGVLVMARKFLFGSHSAPFHSLTASDRAILRCVFGIRSCTM